MFLLAGCHVTGAHGTADDFKLAAVARSVAFFDMPNKSHRIAPVEIGLENRIVVTGMNPQGAVHRRRIDDLTRIENIPGIPALLHLFDQFEIVSPEDDRNKFPPEPSIAVFTT